MEGVDFHDVREHVEIIDGVGIGRKVFATVSELVHGGGNGGNHWTPLSVCFFDGKQLVDIVALVSIPVRNESAISIVQRLVEPEVLARLFVNTEGSTNIVYEDVVDACAVSFVAKGGVLWPRVIVEEELVFLSDVLKRDVCHLEIHRGVLGELIRPDGIDISSLTRG